MENEIAPPSLALKTANPGPLGLAGFGLTTVALSCVNAGLLPPEAIGAVVPLAFAYGVAFVSYGLFWWWFAFMKWTVGAGWLATPPAAGVAMVLLLWGVFTFLLWIVSFRLSKGVWSIFLLLWITFFFLAGGDFGYLIGSLTCGKIGGYFGLLTGIDALLVAFIEILNATAGRVVISPGRPFFER
jgi:succinate-acetate transporter protein